MWIGDGRAWIIVYGILILIATQITMVFAGCAIQPDANGHVDIPSNWKGIGSGRYSFKDCTSLKTVSIPASVTSIDYMAFADCSSLFICKY